MLVDGRPVSFNNAKVPLQPDGFMNGPTPLSLLETLKKNPSDPAALRGFGELYGLWMRSWLSGWARLPYGDPTLEELVRQALGWVIRYLSTYQPGGQVGPFRIWFRRVLARVLNQCLSQPGPIQTTLAPRAAELNAVLTRLDQNQSDLAQEFDRQHQEQVGRALLERARTQFRGPPWEVFQRLTLDGQAPEAVAANLSLNPSDIWLYNARVIAWLRLEGQAFLD